MSILVGFDSSPVTMFSGWVLSDGWHCLAICTSGTFFDGAESREIAEHGFNGFLLTKEGGAVTAHIGSNLAATDLEVYAMGRFWYSQHGMLITGGSSHRLLTEEQRLRMKDPVRRCFRPF